MSRLPSQKCGKNCLIALFQRLNGYNRGSGTNQISYYPRIINTFFCNSCKRIQFPLASTPVCYNWRPERGPERRNVQSSISNSIANRGIFDAKLLITSDKRPKYSSVPEEFQARHKQLNIQQDEPHRTWKMQRWVNKTCVCFNYWEMVFAATRHWVQNAVGVIICAGASR